MMARRFVYSPAFTNHPSNPLTSQTLGGLPAVMSQVLPLMPDEVNDASSETSIWREAEAAQIGSGDVDAAEAQTLTALEHAVRLAARINSNAHGMRDTEGRNSDVAIGVFPQVEPRAALRVARVWP